jgi:ADP-ribose pyrophosphatase YjhB (NUDIX family)
MSLNKKKNYVSDWEKLKNILCHREYQVTNELFVDNQTGAFSNMNGAGILLFNSNYSKILLVCDSRSSKWSFPKGRFEKNETVRDTAIREMQEETEFEYPVDYQFVIWPAFKVFQYYIFIGKLNDNENVNSKIFIPNIEQHIKDIKWFDKNEIRQLKKYEMNLVTFTIINEWKNI